MGKSKPVPLRLYCCREPVIASQLTTGVVCVRMSQKIALAVLRLEPKAVHYQSCPWHPFDAFNLLSHSRLELVKCFSLYAYLGVQAESI